MAWATRQFSKSQIDRAGNALVALHSGGGDTEDIYRVINNWRSTHAYPLNTFQITLRNRARRLESSPIVAQRIKRLESIYLKLSRENGMNLSRMQDIGGCRAVMRTLKKAKELVDVYKSTDFGHILRNEKDYIALPKTDGYRSYHLIYQYVGTPSTVAYTGLQIEVQIRSQMQHAWATAVEAVGTFTQQALKSNQGSADWKRFFALMGTAIAVREGCPRVPGTPKTDSSLKKELTYLVKSLGVHETLRTYQTTLQYMGEQKSRSKFFLVELDPSEQSITVQGFLAKASQAANEAYTRRERETSGAKGRQLVLVSVDAVSALERAYPNYFMDTEKFSSLLRDVLAA